MGLFERQHGHLNGQRLTSIELVDVGIGELPVFIRFNNTEGAMREKNENETLTSELIFHLSRSAWGNRNPILKKITNEIYHYPNSCIY